jgi:xylitol oxidase
LRNWAGNYEYRARALHVPRTLDQLRRDVAGAESLHVLGSRHSFTGIGDAEEHITLEELPADVSFDGDTVTFSAGMKYGELATVLKAAGHALHNLASLPHISVAGAVATATHGSGERHGNLATAVAALELVTPAGDVVRLARGDADFDGAVVGLGALGVVTRITLDIEPEYEVATRVFEHVPWGTPVLGAGYSVSAFTRWGEDMDMVWVKSRTDEPPPDLPGTPATVEHHPLPGISAESCTPQLGVPGPWSDRLPHFRMEFTPSNGEEIQSEYFVARERADEAIAAMREVGPRILDLLQVCELRTIAADRLWLSPQHGQDTFAIHFTWRRDQAAVERALAHVEEALLPLGALPHWGKLFVAPPRYQRIPDFVGLARRYDPRGVFSNAWTEANLHAAQ